MDFTYLGTCTPKISTRTPAMPAWSETPATLPIGQLNWFQIALETSKRDLKRDLLLHEKQEHDG